MKRLFLVLAVVLVSVASIAMIPAPVTSSNLCSGGDGNGGLWSVDELSDGTYVIVTSSANGEWCSEEVSQVAARKHCLKNME